MIVAIYNIYFWKDMLVLDLTSEFELYSGFFH